ncbi:hypothetical protein HN588_11630 [Candidatus Bathyarchaeota archaeon]|mgnify:FL=1|nr:hypothetical protein [Candidatus Bathyarchaeota archaeon]
MNWFLPQQPDDSSQRRLARSSWKSLFRRAAVVFTGLVLIGVLLMSGMTLGTFLRSPMPESPMIPVTSYVHLTTHGHFVSVLEFCDLEDPDCELPETRVSRISAASAVKISGDRLLTAGHVCEAAIEAQGAVGTMDLDGDVLVDLDFVATDYLGQQHEVTMRAIHADHDLCILHAVDVAGSEATISDERPFVTERIWNVASPRGIFTPGVPIILDGIYTGQLKLPFGDQYTIPGAPGSSGSPVFRSDGTLVGIIHSVNPTFEHATYAATLESVQEIERVTREQ